MVQAAGLWTNAGPDAARRATAFAGIWLRADGTERQTLAATPVIGLRAPMTAS
jgi:hypothetical protein